MDVIEDTELALDAYQQSPSSDPGSMYLEVYGALQALEVQQLAAEQLDVILAPSRGGWPTELYEIRELRHRAVGHPTKTDPRPKHDRREGYHGITRVTMRPGGFDLNSWEKDPGGELEYRPLTVDVFQVIARQESLLADVLQGVASHMDDDNRAHRAQFGRSSAAACLDGRHYPLQKLLTLDEAVGASAAAELERLLDVLVNELQRRTPHAATVFESVTSSVDEAKYFLAQVKAFLGGNPDNLGARVAEALARDVDRWFGHLAILTAEIDEDYGVFSESEQAASGATEDIS